MLARNSSNGRGCGWSPPVPLTPDSHDGLFKAAFGRPELARTDTSKHVVSRVMASSLQSARIRLTADVALTRWLTRAVTATSETEVFGQDSG